MKKIYGLIGRNINYSFSAKHQGVTRILATCYVYLGLKITLVLVSSIYNYSYHRYLSDFFLYSNSNGTLTRIGLTCQSYGSHNLSNGFTYKPIYSVSASISSNIALSDINSFQQIAPDCAQGFSYQRIYQNQPTFQR